MNNYLKGKVQHPLTSRLTVLLVGLMIFLAAFTLIGGNTEPATNQTQPNQTDVNVTESYDNQTQPCQDPEVNLSNKSQIKQCVSNQTK